jgi:hypothetical protein
MWLGEADEQFQAFTGYFLCDVYMRQLQFDELYAVLRDLKTGEWYRALASTLIYD